MPSLLGPTIAPPNARPDKAELPDLFPEPPVDHWGRYILEGKSYTRATTIAHALDDSYHLHRWQERMVILGLTGKPALWQHAVSLHPDDRRGLNKLAEEAREAAGANDRARIGSARHRLYEYLDTGRLQLSQVMDLEARTDAEAYQAILNQAGLQLMEGWCEAIIAIDTMKVAGTIDRVVMGADGKLRILDLKTSADMKWSYDTWAMQVAVYSRATHVWDRATDQLIKLTTDFNQLSRVPGVEIDRHTAYILHQPAGTGTAYLYEVPLDTAQAAVDLAMEVRKIKGFGKREMRQVEAYDPKAELSLTAESLRARCQRMIEHNAAASGALAARWPPGVPDWVSALNTGHSYTRAELDTIDAIVSEGESAMGLPFLTDAETRKFHPGQLGASLVEPEPDEQPWDEPCGICGQAQHDGPCVDEPGITPEQDSWAQGEQVNPMPPDVYVPIPPNDPHTGDKPGGVCSICGSDIYLPLGTYGLPCDAEGTVVPKPVTDAQGTIWKPDPSGHWFPMSDEADGNANVTPANAAVNQWLPDNFNEPMSVTVSEAEAKVQAGEAFIWKPAESGLQPPGNQPAGVLHYPPTHEDPMTGARDKRHGFAPVSHQSLLCWCGEQAGNQIHSVVPEVEDDGRHLDRSRPSSMAHIPGVRPPIEAFGEVPPQPSQAELDARRPYSDQHPPAVVYPPEDYPQPHSGPVQAILDAFPGAKVVVDSPKPLDPAVLELVERINALPSDLRGKLDSQARQHKIRNLKDPRNPPTDDELQLVTHWLHRLEMECNERANRFEEAIPEVEIWTPLAQRVLLGPWRGPTQHTVDELETIKAVYRAEQQLFFEGTADDARIRPIRQAELGKLITKNHGSASAAKLAAKRWAMALGRPTDWRCTTVKAMSAHPIIGPVMGFGPAIETPDEKTGAEDTEADDAGT